MINWLDQNDRIMVIKAIKDPENKERKNVSLKQYEILNDRLYQYVYDYLKTQFSDKTVKEMPIISSVNLAQRIVKQEASLYKARPTREFYNVSDDQKEALHELYEKMNVDDKMLRANEMFKAQQQTTVQVSLVEKELKLRNLWAHQVDVIPDDENPEKAQAYIISTFDKQNSFDNHQSKLSQSSSYSGLMPDHQNQLIADGDDYKAKLNRFYVWTKEMNFVMDGNGVILSQDTENSMQHLPFTDIASSKDFEFWVRQGEGVTDFTIQFNALLSDIANVVRMQGWGQAYFKGPESAVPTESLQVGLNKVLMLYTDANNAAETEFGFAQPSADITGSLEFLKSTLSIFLSSKGLNPKVASLSGESEKFTSGVDRMLSMIQQFEASKSDAALFEHAEDQIFQSIRAYINTYQGTDFLDDKYSIGEIPEDAYVTIHYAEPQSIQSNEEKLTQIKTEIELGLKSRLKAIEEYYDIEEEEALKLMGEIDNEKKQAQPKVEPKALMDGVNGRDQGTETNQA